jgi:hypothetical protein
MKFMGEANPFQITEEEKLKKALSRTYEERFFFLMKLIKINKMLRSAKIIHKKAENDRYSGFV